MEKHGIQSGRNNNKVNTSDVVNNLTSTSTTKPLSAAQGKVLNDNLGQVSNSLVWKFHKQVSGAEVIYLPTVPYNELKFITIFEYFDVQFVIPTHIARIEIENNGDYHRFYLNGGYSSTNFYTDYRLAVTSHIAILNTLRVKGENFTNNCVTLCYYR